MATRLPKLKTVDPKRRTEILTANVFRYPEWSTSSEKGKRLQTNTRRANTAIKEIQGIIEGLPTSERMELEADLIALKSASEVLSQVAYIFERGKEFSEKAAKKAQAERDAKRKADVAALVTKLFGAKLDPDFVRTFGEDLLLFQSDPVVAAYVKSLGYDGGMFYVNKVYEIQHAIKKSATALAQLLAEECLDAYKTGRVSRAESGDRYHCGWEDFEKWRASRNRDVPSIR